MVVKGLSVLLLLRLFLLITVFLFSPSSSSSSFLRWPSLLKRVSCFLVLVFCPHRHLVLCTNVNLIDGALCSSLSSFVLTSLFFCAHLSLLSPPLSESMHLPQALINPTRHLHPLAGCQCSESAPTGVNYLACKRELRRGDGAENMTRRRAALGRRRGARALFGPLRSDSVNKSEP